MTLGSLLSLALVLFIFITVALCTSWAWGSRNYILAVSLTIVFIASCVGLWAYMEHYGASR